MRVFKLLNNTIVFIFIIFTITACGEEINYKYDKDELPSLKVIEIKINPLPPDMTSYIEIKFNTLVSRSSLYKGISCESGGKKAFLYFYLISQDDGDLIRVNPFYPFLPYVTYICKITKDVTDIYKNNLEKEYVFKFKTSGQYFKNREFNPKYYSFNQTYKFIKRRCVHCHNESHDLNFNLAKNELFDLLLNHKNKKTGRNLIIPYDIDNSYLINKLMGVNFYGKKMPSDAKIPIFELEKIIGWTKLGAKYEQN